MPTGAWSFESGRTKSSPAQSLIPWCVPSPSRGGDGPHPRPPPFQSLCGGDTVDSPIQRLDPLSGHFQGFASPPTPASPPHCTLLTPSVPAPRGQSGLGG